MNKIKCKICDNEYTRRGMNGHISSHKISVSDYKEKYGDYSKTDLHKCKMCDNDIPTHRIYCSNDCKFSDDDYNDKRKKKRGHLNPIDKNIKCNYCGYTSTDISNLSGALTKHLNDSHNIELDCIDSHFRTFDVEEKEKWKCSYCDWDTIDIKNLSGCITNHLQREHDCSLSEYNSQHPDNKIKTLQYQRNQKLIDSKNYIECQICGDKLHIISNTHCMNKHGITQKEYKELYGDDIISETMSNALRKCGGTKKFISNGEQEVYDYIKSIGVDDAIQTKYLGGIEIDIYSDLHDIGIEYNGLYWHSELHGRDKEYHLHKTNYCESKGIRLIHIFEDEWINKKDIVKSRIKSLFKKSKNVFYARKCDIREISTNNKSKFLKKYHLQGNDKSKIKLGAFYEGELVSVCTFSKKRIALGSSSEDGIFELNRFCSVFDTSVVGILPRFLSYIGKNYDINKIITYADRRYSSKDNIYELVGFDYVHTTKPNYFYMINYSERKHRFNFTKRKFVEMGGDEELTEWENAVNMGYDRIWDSGHLKYEFNLNKNN